MNEKLGYIYAITNQCFDNYIGHAKIGSTRNYLNRLSNYITYYPKLIKILKVFAVYRTAKTLYEIDTIYYVDFMIQNTDFFNKLNEGGGIEHYYQIENIETQFRAFFNRLHLRVRDITNKAINKFPGKINYIEIGQELDESSKIHRECNETYGKIINYIRKPITLFDYQYADLNYWKPFLENIENETLEQHNAICCLPTGMGKSFIALAWINLFKQIVHSCENHNILWLTKRKDIIVDMHESDKIERMRYSNMFPTQMKILYQIDELNSWESLTNTLVIVNIDKLNIQEHEENVEFRRYEKINFENFGAIIFDECHWSLAKTYAQLVSHISRQNSIRSIVAYSATPIRKKYIDTAKILYTNGTDNISFSSYITPLLAMKNKQIMIPQIHLLCIPEIIYQEEMVINFQMLFGPILDIIETSHYKKAILWTNTIENCNRHYENMKQYISENDMNYTVLISHSQMERGNITLYKQIKRNVLLFVVNQASEGFDDIRTDNTINLDFVEKRGIIFDIQKMGRAQRLNKHKIVVNHVENIGSMSPEIDNLVDRIYNYYTYITGLFMDITQPENKVEKLRKRLIVDDCKLKIKIGKHSFVEINISQVDTVKLEILREKVIEKMELDLNVHRTESEYTRCKRLVARFRDAPKWIHEYNPFIERNNLEEYLPSEAQIINGYFVNHVFVWSDYLKINLADFYTLEEFFDKIDKFLREHIDEVINILSNYDTEHCYLNYITKVDVRFPVDPETIYGSKLEHLNYITNKVVELCY